MPSRWKPCRASARRRTPSSKACTRPKPASSRSARRRASAASPGSSTGPTSWRGTPPPSRRPAAHPVLLSNGNLDSGENGRAPLGEIRGPVSQALLSLRAGRREPRRAGRPLRHALGKEAKLFVYVEPGKLDQADWSMDCLKRAIRWDEQRFGLELDLD